MLTLIFIGLFSWLFVTAIGWIIKLTWGATKIAAGVLVAGILCAVALPVLVLCLIFAGSLSLLLPIAFIGIACAILKAEL